MITRFAPSPTGPLHLGHAFSALTVWQVAQENDGTALLRIEDTDSTRVRPQFEDAIYDDLRWLGLDWPEPVRRQSDHAGEYRETLRAFSAMSVLYPCSCNRRAIQAAGASRGQDGFVYPGTCRARAMSDVQPGDSIRLDIGKALARINSPLSYVETGQGGTSDVTVTDDHLLKQIGDPVLLRKETGDPSYHLACTHDDANQGITHVVRGRDIEGLTAIHLILQKLMGWPTPIYHHHDLITDEAGQRLAKIDHSKALSAYRQEGMTVDDIRRMVGFPRP